MSGETEVVSGAKGGAQTPQTVEEISNPPQPPVIPSGWVSRPGRNGGEIYFPAGTDQAKGSTLELCHLAHHLYQDTRMDTGVGRTPANNR